jgi:hypothetical protein
MSFVAHLAASLSARKTSKKNPESIGDPAEPSLTGVEPILGQEGPSTSTLEPNHEPPEQEQEPSTFAPDVAAEAGEEPLEPELEPDPEPDSDPQPTRSSMHSIHEDEESPVEHLETDLPLKDLPSTSGTLASGNEEPVNTPDDPIPKFRSFKRHSLDQGAMGRRASQDLSLIGFPVTHRRSSMLNQRRSSIEKEGSLMASPEICMQIVAKLIQKLILALIKRPCFIFLEDAHVSCPIQHSTVLKFVTINKKLLSKEQTYAV